MLRHTRQLLREYQQAGHLNATLTVRPAWRDAEELEQLSDEQVESLVLKNRAATDLTWEQGEIKRLLAMLEDLPAVPAKTYALLGIIQQRRQAGSDRRRFHPLYGYAGPFARGA